MENEIPRNTEGSESYDAAHDPHYVAASQPKQPLGPVPAPKPKRNRLLTILTITVVVVLLAIGIVPRIRQQMALNQASAQVKKSHPVVNVIKPKLTPPTNVVDLPGTIEAVEQTSVNARATGYVDKVFVDIGSKVVAGQTLATITAPDTDQQTQQGRAQLLQAEAAVSQADANLAADEGAVAQQEANLGHYRAAYLQAKAAVYQDDAQLAQAQHQYKEQQQAISEQVANTNLANVTNQRQQYLYQQGVVAKQTADQSQASYLANQADLSLNQSALSASASNVQAYQANIQAGQANAEAAKQDIGVAQAEVATSLSNIRAAQAAIAAAQATVGANRAALARLVDLQNYETVTAPFAGIVTSRNVDPGAYISSGSSPSSSGTSAVGSSAAGTSVTGSAASGSVSSGGSSSDSSSTSGSGGGTPTGLFTVASINRLRIYLNLPQADADAVQVGQKAVVTALALPLKKFTGTITQSAVALDPTSRTLVAEVQLNNPGGVLRPGMFGQVKVTVPQTERLLMIPDTAILTGPSGPQVVIITDQKKVHFQNVSIGQDNGKTMQILSGLKPTDHVVSAPNYNLVEGETVTVQKRTKGKGMASAS
jgi:multidrug efflux pump subunit AcrA (membrane-fusion protein)